jgi:PleD family two-component response regulator
MNSKTGHFAGANGPGSRDRRGMQPDAASALGGEQPTRILIVDDHAISCAALRARLRPRAAR